MKINIHNYVCHMHPHLIASIKFHGTSCKLATETFDWAYPASFLQVHKPFVVHASLILQGVVFLQVVLQVLLQNKIGGLRTCKIFAGLAKLCTPWFPLASLFCMGQHLWLHQGNGKERYLEHLNIKQICFVSLPTVCMYS